MRIGRRAALSILGVAACARPRKPAEAIEVVIPNDPGTLDPRFVTDVYGLRIARLVHGALIAPDAGTAAPQPWLASTIDDEGTGLLISLRDDVRFHDGSPITANDVVATMRALVDETLASPFRRVLSEVTVSSVDARRVRIVPRTPRATLRADLDFPVLKADEAHRPRGAPLTGSGPFRLASVDPGAVSLVGRRSIVVRTVRDEAARALRIVAGSVDVASNVLAPPLALSLPTRSDAHDLVATRRPSAATTFLALQCERPPLDRPEVRRAIGMAIDRRAIVDAKLGGAAALAGSLSPPTIALAPRTLRQLPYDPAHARSVLAPLGARFTLATTTDRTRIGIARAIAQNISDAGVPTEVRTYEFGTFYARLAAGEFDLATMIAPEITDPDVLRWYLHSSSIPPRAANRARFRDPHVDELLDRGLAGGDRLGIYEELEAVLHEAMPYVPLWHEDHVAVLSQRARDFRPSVDGRWGALADL
ncbi:MAG: ABC transporter substrate-binding protein [Polyangiales bacterium]